MSAFKNFQYIIEVLCWNSMLTISLLACRETSKYLGGGLLGPCIFEVPEGHRHTTFRVHHFQLESMGSDNEAVMRKIKNSSHWPLLAEKMPASVYGSHDV